MPLAFSELEFRLEDRVAGEALTSANVDLPTLRGFLEDIENLIRGDETAVSFENSRVRVEDGSLKIVALVEPALAASLGTDISRLKETGDLDLIQPRRAQVLEQWQKRAKASPSRSYQLPVTAGQSTWWITKDTSFQRGGLKGWLSVEKYLTGKVIDAGGKVRPNLHLEVKGSRRSLRISATERQISGVKENLLYRVITLRVEAEQNLHTRQLRRVRLLEFVPEASQVDEEALQRLWQRGTRAWADVGSASAWVETLRGNTEQG